MPKLKNLMGMRFGKLIVCKLIKKPGYESKWLCDCDCGNQIAVKPGNLVYGGTKSCGCLRRPKGPSTRTRPSRKGETKLSWESMLSRCLCSSSTQFYNYGAKGIKIHPRWNEYSNFLADMGERPLGHTLDRIDNTGDYEPGNCRWSTPKQQANNRRDNKILSAFGREQTMRQWADEFGIPPGTLDGRLKKHSLETALTMRNYDNLRSQAMKETYRNRKSTRWIEAFGQRKPLIEWSEQCGIKAAVILGRINRRGMTPEQALTTPVTPRGKRHLGMKKIQEG